ncbi:MAG: tRNA (adenosine(37)-N6)-threonylcarbamoyltransferase complex dimerization subunit type 1 TsaB [Oceanospirillaceae bacterium]
MTKILALDTSTDACSVALEVAGERSEIFRVIPRRHTHELLPMVQQILAQAQLKVQDLDAIAFGRGPGSFAGIRIATGVAQGLAYAADLPVVPVSSLAALAQGYYRNTADANSQIVTAFDARMDEVYWGVYKIEAGVATLVVAEAVCAPSDLIFDFEQTYIGVGSGFNYREKMPAQLLSALTSVTEDEHPHSLDILAIASQQYALGNTVSAEEAQPVYLRNQVTWKKKDQQ